jgi:hypothetical protein
MEPYAGGVSGFYDEKICLWDLAAQEWSFSSGCTIGV